MVYTDFLKAADSGRWERGYLFYGAEEYLKRYALDRVKTALFPDPALLDWNRRALDDENYTPADLREALSMPAVMTERTLVTLSLSSFAALKEKDRASLYDVLDTTLPSADGTVFLLILPEDGFDPGTQKRPSAAFRSLTKSLTPVEFPEQTDARLGRWMEKHLAAYGVTMDPACGQFLRDRCGKRMDRLSGELAKLGAYAASHGKTAVTTEMIAAVCTPTDEDDAFRLANCILRGDAAGAYDCLRLKKARREDPIQILSQIQYTIVDLALASAYIREKRTAGEYAADMGQHEYRVGLYFRARRLSGRRHAALVRRCRLHPHRAADRHHCPLTRDLSRRPILTCSRRISARQVRSTDPRGLFIGTCPDCPLGHNLLSLAFGFG